MYEMCHFQGQILKEAAVSTFYHLGSLAPEDATATAEMREAVSSQTPHSEELLSQDQLLR